MEGNQEATIIFGASTQMTVKGRNNTENIRVKLITDVSPRILDRNLILAGIIRTKGECLSHQAPPRLIFTLLGVTIALTGHAAAGERYTIVSVVPRGTSLKGGTNKEE